MNRRRRAVDPRTGRLYRILGPSKTPAHAPTTRAVTRPSFDRPPRALRTARLDNLAIVPASLLPYKEEYQAIANQQPPGTTLVVLPAGDSLPRRTLQIVATRLRDKGRPVRIIPSSACAGVR